MKDDLLEFSIVNWEKYNPRKDLKNPKWFRFNNDFFADEKILNLTAAEFKVFVLFLCLRSRANTELVQSSYRVVTRLIHSRTKIVHSAIQKLEQNGLLKIFSRTDPCITIQDEQKLKVTRTGHPPKRSQCITFPGGPSVDNGAPAVEKSEQLKKRAAKFIAAYVVAYKERYGTRPVVDSKSTGLIKNMLKNMSDEQASLLVETYLKMDGNENGGRNGWFATKCHDVVTFVNNLNVISSNIAKINERADVEDILFS